MGSKFLKPLHCAILVAVVLALLPAHSAQAGNNWYVGATVGLCAGTEIRHGSSYSYGVHTVVPENNWPVKVINGPRYADGQTWWDISRREIDGGGTGWVVQSQADQCYTSPPPQPPPPPPPPNPPPPPPDDPPVFNCVNATFTPQDRRIGPWVTGEYWLHREWEEFRASGRGGYYCSNMVTVEPDGWTLHSGDYEFSLDSQARPVGYGVGREGLPGAKVGVSESPRGIYAAVSYTHSARWPYQNARILDVSVEQEVRRIYEVREPDWNWSYSYKELLVISGSKIIVVGVIAYFAFAEVTVPITAAALILLFVADTMGVETSETSLLAARLASPPLAAARADVDETLVNTLRQSYGPMIDSVNLRSMQVQQVNVRAANSSLQASGSDDNTNVLPAVDFRSTGFTPGAQVLVALDRAGRLIAETSVTASAAGDIEGQFTLPPAETTQAGTLTIIAVDQQEIHAQLMAPPATALLTGAASEELMNMAAAQLIVAPAPRLVGSVVFDPLPLVAHRETTATFTVQNVGDVPLPLQRLLLAGRGPDCEDWCDGKWADWPVIENLNLAPGDTYTWSSKRALVQPGEYQFVVAYQDAEGDWHDADASPRFRANVQPGIVASTLTISPAAPQAGEVVTAQIAFRNDSSATLDLWNVYVAGKGPDCNNGWECQDKWADMPTTHRVRLEPGEEYVYYQRRSFPLPGAYFLQGAYQFTPNDWQTAGSRLDFRLSNGIRVVRPLTLDPAQPMAGEAVQATYTIRNEGASPVVLPYLGVVARGPDCAGSSWECNRYGDWPWVGSITLAPGAEYTFHSTRIFDNPGTGYWAEPHLADWNPWWQMIDGGERVPFAVQPGLTLVEPLSLTPGAPVAGETVRARAVLQNQGARPIRLSRLLVGAQGPNCVDFGCAAADASAWGDFPPRTDLTLQPGETFTFETSRMWLRTGPNYIAQLLYQFGLDDWHSLGEVSRFAVGPGLQLMDGLYVTPTSPQPGQTYTGTYTLYNAGPRPLVIPAVGVGGRGTDCDDATCHNSAGMAAYFDVQIAPGGHYEYVAQRSIAAAGSYWAEPFMLVAQPDWWVSLAPLREGSRAVFTIGDVTPPLVLQPCTITIERGATFTNKRDVELMINVPGATLMLVSNDGGFINAVSMPYGPQFNWSFPSDIGNRVATVMVRVRAFDGDKQLCGADLSDDVILDALPPSVTAAWQPNKVAASAATSSIGTLVIHGEDQADGSGLVDMQISESPEFPDPSWESYAAERQIYALSGTTLYVRVRDRAGNISGIEAVPVQGTNRVLLPFVLR